jgi:hypothetical protein
MGLNSYLASVVRKRINNQEITHLLGLTAGQTALEQGGVTDAAWTAEIPEPSPLVAGEQE